MPNSEYDESLHERFLHADDEMHGTELARDVLDGQELHDYLQRQTRRHR